MKKFLSLLAAALMRLWASQPHRSAVPPPDAPRTEEVSSLFSGQYLSIGKAQAIADEVRAMMEADRKAAPETAEVRAEV